MEQMTEKNENTQALEVKRIECINALNELMVLPDVCMHYRAFNKINKFKRWLLFFDFNAESTDESSTN